MDEGIRLWCLKIVYRSGKTNTNADALSRNPQAPAPAEELDEVQVTMIHKGSDGDDIDNLLHLAPVTTSSESLAHEQRKDQKLSEVTLFLQQNRLPLDQDKAHKLALQGNMFVLVDQVLHYLDPKAKNIK